MLRQGVGLRQAGLAHMDVGELGQDVDEEAAVPTGTFQFAPHWPLARFQSCKVQRQFAQRRQVLRTMSLQCGGGLAWLSR